MSHFTADQYANICCKYFFAVMMSELILKHMTMNIPNIEFWNTRFIKDNNNFVDLHVTCYDINNKKLRYHVCLCIMSDKLPGTLYSMVRDEPGRFVKKLECIHIFQPDPIWGKITINFIKVCPTYSTVPCANPLTQRYIPVHHGKPRFSAGPFAAEPRI